MAKYLQIGDRVRIIDKPADLIDRVSAGRTGTIMLRNYYTNMYTIQTDPTAHYNEYGLIIAMMESCEKYDDSVPNDSGRDLVGSVHP